MYNRIDELIRQYSKTLATFNLEREITPTNKLLSTLIESSILNNMLLNEILEELKNGK